MIFAEFDTRFSFKDDLQTDFLLMNKNYSIRSPAWFQRKSKSTKSINKQQCDFSDTFKYAHSLSECVIGTLSPAIRGF